MDREFFLSLSLCLGWNQVMRLENAEWERHVSIPGKRVGKGEREREGIIVFYPLFKCTWTTKKRMESEGGSVWKGHTNGLWVRRRGMNGRKLHEKRNKERCSMLCITLWNWIWREGKRNNQEKEKMYLIQARNVCKEKEKMDKYIWKLSQFSWKWENWRWRMWMELEKKFICKSFPFPSLPSLHLFMLYFHHSFSLSLSQCPSHVLIHRTLGTWNIWCHGHRVRWWTRQRGERPFMIQDVGCVVLPFDSHFIPPRLSVSASLHPSFSLLVIKPPPFTSSFSLYYIHHQVGARIPWRKEIKARYKERESEK